MRTRRPQNLAAIRRMPILFSSTLRRPTFTLGQHPPQSTPGPTWERSWGRWTSRVIHGQREAASTSALTKNRRVLVAAQPDYHGLTNLYETRQTQRLERRSFAYTRNSDSVPEFAWTDHAPEAAHESRPCRRSLCSVRDSSGSIRRISRTICLRTRCH